MFIVGSFLESRFMSSSHIAHDGQPFVSDSLLHKLRLQVFSLRQEIKALRAEVKEARSLATEALIEVKALKNSSLVSLLAPAYPTQQDEEVSDTPEDYTALKAEKVVDSLFSSIDSAFGRPRGM